MVFFGQTKIGYGTQTSSYDVTVKDGPLAPIGSERTYQVEVESRRDIKPNVVDYSPLLELSNKIMEYGKRRDANYDRWARSNGYYSYKDYKRKQRSKNKKARKKYRENRKIERENKKKLKKILSEN